MKHDMTKISKTLADAQAELATLKSKLTTHEAAERLGVSWPTIRRWIDRGYLAVERHGNYQLVALADLIRCKAQRRPGRPRKIMPTK